MKQTEVRNWEVMLLPGVVLFPGMLLPLHIFEPRYRMMLERALDGDRLFAIGMAVDSGFVRVFGSGIIKACVRNDGGTYQILVEGMSRHYVEDVISSDPVLQVKARLLD